YFVTPELAAVKLLGVRQGGVRDTTRHVNLQAWNFAPGDTVRDEDRERYAIMAATSNTVLEPLPTDLSPRDGAPVELVTVGPFAQVNVGDSLEVDFVYFGATDNVNLNKRAHTAQRAYDLHYIVPVPPPSPLFRAVAREGAIDYYWD